MTKSRGIAGPRDYWTPEDEQRLAELFPHSSTRTVAAAFNRTEAKISAKAARMGLRKSAEYLASPDACRLRRDCQAGIRYRFPKGNVPWNKDIPRRKGWAPGRMAETQFKKGCRTGRANMNYKPIGAERISKDGYLERKIHDGLPMQSRWRAVHLLLWEEIHGKVPKGHALAFRNGHRLDVRIDNLELITRRELMARNTFHNMPEPLPELVLLRGRLNRKINKRTRAHEEQDGRPA
jgi:hypothetical protein